MPHPTFQMALAQMRVEGGCPQANLERAGRRIAQAARAGAELVLLPEALDLGWTHETRLAEPIPHGRWCERLQADARRHRIHVCAGLIERAEARCYNAALLLDPDGRILLHHRKLNELEIAQPRYTSGGSLGVARTALGTVGLMICSDAFARGQVLARSLGWMGADLLLSPCAWAVPPGYDHARTPYGSLWLDNYQPVARDHRLWIAAASSVGRILQGPWQGHLCIGHSLLIDPRGEVALRGPYGAEADTLLVQRLTLVPRPAQGNAWNAILSNP